MSRNSNKLPEKWEFVLNTAQLDMRNRGHFSISKSHLKTITTASTLLHNHSKQQQSLHSPQFITCSGNPGRKKAEVI